MDEYKPNPAAGSLDDEVERVSSGDLLIYVCAALSGLVVAAAGIVWFLAQ